MIGALIVVMLADSARAASTTAKPQDQQPLHKISAPADRYFGRMKLSYLGINNTFQHAHIRAGAYTTDPDVMHKLTFADEALHDWMRQFPNDPHLPRSFYLASEMYKKIWTKQYQDKAWEYMQLLQSKYASTFFGKQVKKDTANGFTQHYFAEPRPCPTIQPSVSASPSANLESTATASPPIAAPSSTQPKVQIETPPCISPATPTPSAKESPQASL
ncbi:MAG: hypothetical protein M3Z14_05310 [Candidatus Eremiobacteraeota bacterium]|nr:hypothetical protein [Candidatus Eremiobacteraeota bacterium]